MKMLSLATFNIRGLTEEIKKDHLASDLNRYDIDVCGLQETKISNGADVTIQGHRLICFKSECEHYGNGFMVNNRLVENIEKYWRVSDRISVTQFSSLEHDKYKSELQHEHGLKMTIAKRTVHKSELTGSIMKIMKVKPKFILSIINVYAPHTGRVKDDPKELNDLYDDLNNVLDKLSSTTTIIIGDWNAKVGKRTDLDNCLGRYSRGRRNLSGQQLIDFCEAYNYKVANSCFQHPARHQTTWSQKRTITDKDNEKLITIFNMIDYILVPQKLKNNLIDARSYSGTQTSSDHRIVISKIKIDKFTIFKQEKNTEKPKRYNIQGLITNKEIRKEYEENIEKELNTMERKEWENVNNVMKEVTEEKVGFVKGERHKQEYSKKIEELSNTQKRIWIEINNTEDVTRTRQLRSSRNKILREIKKEQQEIVNNNIDTIVKEIENAQNDRKMYQAIKLLNKPKRKNNSLVHDKNGNCITNKIKMNEVITEHFKEHFYNENTPNIEPFIGEPRNLNIQITSKEVEKAITRMSNQDKHQDKMKFK